MNSVAMLESVISAAVNSQYKDVPPTEEEFVTLANTMRQNMAGSFPVSDDEFEDILFRLRSSLVIQMDVGIFINDRTRPHKS